MAAIIKFPDKKREEQIETKRIDVLVKQVEVIMLKMGRVLTYEELRQGVIGMEEDFGRVVGVRLKEKL